MFWILGLGVWLEVQGCHKSERRPITQFQHERTHPQTLSYAENGGAHGSTNSGNLAVVVVAVLLAIARVKVCIGGDGAVACLERML